MPSRRLCIAAAVAVSLAAPAVVAGASRDCGTYDGQGCAPASARVDLRRPVFSHPTRITNPLFPISRLQSAVLLGRVDGQPFRSETTLLPRTSAVVWDGKRIRVRLSQYMAFVNERIDEVALDRYAQADDGSVWYLGEDVVDYRRGTIFVSEGTWLAGRDGPPAMIMPARPKVGDAFRTENIPGVVFEEVTVNATGRTVRGPHGPVAGAMVGNELHLDGSHSPKTFAPGYGEFLTIEGHDVEALALAAPTDRLPGRLPAHLRSLVTRSFAVVEDARLADWDAATANAGAIRASWGSIKPLAPPLIAPPLLRDIDSLVQAARAHRADRTARLALGVARFALDLQLRFRPVSAVDAERFHLWTQQLRVDAAARDLAAVTGDTATLEWLRDRLTGALRATALRQLDTGLRDLRVATDARNLPAAADHAARLGALVRRAA